MSVQTALPNTLEKEEDKEGKDGLSSKLNYRDAALANAVTDSLIASFVSRDAALATAVTDSLISWLDREVSGKLAAIDRKLEQVVHGCECNKHPASNSSIPQQGAVGFAVSDERQRKGTEDNLDITRQFSTTSNDTRQFSATSNDKSSADRSQPLVSQATVGFKLDDDLLSEDLRHEHEPPPPLPAMQSSKTIEAKAVKRAQEDKEGRRTMFEDDENRDSLVERQPTPPPEDDEGTESSGGLFDNNPMVNNAPREITASSQLGIVKRYRFEKIWHFLEDPESSRGATVYSYTMQAIIVGSVFITLLQSVQPSPLDGELAAVLETCVDSLFMIEFFARFTCCPDKKHFILHVFEVVDLAAWIPILPRLYVGFNLDAVAEDNAWRTVLLFYVPIIRMMKTLRRFQKLHLIVKAFEVVFEALPVLLLIMILVVLVFSTLIFLCEPRDNIEHFPKAMWLTIVTMTTVGYGDVSPVSTEGSLVTAVLIVLSVLYMAMPLGLIGESFGLIWQDRDRLLMMNQVRRRLMQWGYTAEDIPIIFGLFDEDMGGEIELPEFRKMMKEMGIGLKEERVIQLFESLDSNGGGGIDDKEFVRQVFPSYFDKLYHINLDPELGHGAHRAKSSRAKTADFSQTNSRVSSHAHRHSHLDIYQLNPIQRQATKEGKSAFQLSAAARQSFAVRMGTHKNLALLEKLGLRDSFKHGDDSDDDEDSDSEGGSTTPVEKPPTTVFNGAVPEPAGTPTKMEIEEDRPQAWD